MNIEKKQKDNETVDQGIQKLMLEKEKLKEEIDEKQQMYINVRNEPDWFQKKNQNYLNEVNVLKAELDQLK